MVVTARYDQQMGKVVIELESGLEIAFRPQQAQGLETAIPAYLRGPFRIRKKSYAKVNDSFRPKAAG